jgi:hypothetical protein
VTSSRDVLQKENDALKTVHEAVEAKKASGRTSRSHEMTRNLLGGTFCWQSKRRADNQVLAVLCSVFVRVNRSAEMFIATSAASLK